MVATGSELIALLIMNREIVITNKRTMNNKSENSGIAVETRNTVLSCINPSVGLNCLR